FPSSPPTRSDESVKYTVPSAVTSALLQNTNGLPSASVASSWTLPEASTWSSPRRASHTSRGGSGNHSTPSGRPPVFATVPIVPPSGVTRRTRPSSSPHSTEPSSPTSTSSGPSPGTRTVRTAG